MERCAAVARAGVDVRAIRYRDLIGSDKMGTLAALAEPCHLPAAAAETMTGALARDSQARSIVERARQQDYPLTQQDRDSIREVLARSEPVYSEGFLPGAGVEGLGCSTP